MRRTYFNLRDLYKILGVKKGATASDMKSAYKKKAAQLHPDVSKRPNASHEFAELNGAYETLKCEKKRGFYDHTGKPPTSDADVSGYQDFVKAQKASHKQQQRQQRQQQQQPQSPFEEKYGFGGFDFNFADGDPYGGGESFRRFEHNPWEGPGVFYGANDREVPPWEEFMHDTAPRDSGHWRSKRSTRRDEPPSGPPPTRGSNKQIEVSLTLGESIRGITRQVNYEIEKSCNTCDGDGLSKTKATRCANCSGAGRYLIQVTPAEVVEALCEQCNGSGILSKPCHTCKGTTKSLKKASLMVGIPPGLSTGHTIRYVGEGNCGTFGGSNGDLLISLSVTFTDRGYIRAADGTLYVAVKMPITIAIFGGVTVIKTPMGDTHSVAIPPGTTSMDMFDIPIKGLPTWPSNYEIKIKNNKITSSKEPVSGSVKGIAVIDMPSADSLSKSQVEALKGMTQLSTLSSTTISPPVRDSVFKYMLANFSPKGVAGSSKTGQKTESSETPKKTKKSDNKTEKASSGKQKSKEKSEQESWVKFRTKQSPKQKKHGTRKHQDYGYW